MTRTAIQSALTGFTAGPDGQRFTDFVSSHPTPWRRDTPGGHVTCGAIVLDPQARTMVLLYHRRLDRWMQPGGHIEDTDTTVLAACARELAEETGLRVDPTAGLIASIGVFDAVPCGPQAPLTHYDIRALWIHPTVPLIGSAESTDVVWAPLNDLPQPHDHDLASMATFATTVADHWAAL